MFSIQECDKELVEYWRKTHECNAEQTAIGGRLTYCFTPTGLGVITKVECVCGSSIMLEEDF